MSWCNLEQVYKSPCDNLLEDTCLKGKLAGEPLHTSTQENELIIGWQVLCKWKKQWGSGGSTGEGYVGSTILLWAFSAATADAGVSVLQMLVGQTLQEALRQIESPAEPSTTLGPLASHSTWKIAVQLHTLVQLITGLTMKACCLSEGLGPTIERIPPYRSRQPVLGWPWSRVEFRKLQPPLQQIRHGVFSSANKRCDARVSWYILMLDILMLEIDARHFDARHWCSTFWCSTFWCSSILVHFIIEIRQASRIVCAGLSAWKKTQWQNFEFWTLI